MATGKLALGVVGSIIGCCGSCCGLDPFGEEAKEEQVEQQGHEVIPVPHEVEARRAEVERQYAQNLELRGQALQGECHTALDANACVDAYIAENRVEEPAAETPETPVAPTEVEVTDEPDIEVDEAEAEAAEVAEPEAPGDAPTPEPATPSKPKKASKPIVEATLFTATQKGSYETEDGTVLNGTFTGQGAEGTFIGSITEPSGVKLNGRATYTEKSKGGWTGWMRDPDFIVTPYGPANVTYPDNETLAFAFEAEHTGEVDYTKPANYTYNGQTTTLSPYPDPSSNDTSWFNWEAGLSAAESCSPRGTLYYVDTHNDYKLKAETKNPQTQKTDCPAQ